MKCNTCGKEVENNDYCDECIENFKRNIIKKLEQNEKIRKEEKKKKEEIIEFKENPKVCKKDLEDGNETIRYNKFKNFRKIFFIILVIGIIILFILNELKFIDIKFLKEIKAAI